MQRRYRRIVVSLVMALLLSAAGCSWFHRSDGLAGVAPLPLTPILRLSPSVTTAAIPYQNACGEPDSFPVAALLSDGVAAKLGRVFKGLDRDAVSPTRTGSDGVVEVGLGLKQIDLAIHRQRAKNYPVTVTLGLDLSFFDDDGTALFSKKLQSGGAGEVQVTEHSCDVAGLPTVVAEAVDLVTEGMAKQLADSVRVREFAQQRRGAASAAVSMMPPQSGEPAPGEPASSMSSPVPLEPPQGTETASRLSAGHAQAGDAALQLAALTFRAIIRDDNRDQILQSDEPFTIEVEVKNEGAVPAKEVEVEVSGTPLLTAAFPPVLPIGDVEPGEVKRTTSTKRVTAVTEAVRGDLVLSLRSGTPIDVIPPAKKFSVLMRPDAVLADEPSPEVDQAPKAAAALKQPKALVIAIGVGRFRDEQVPPVKYAGRDAEVMAKYLRTIAGIPEDRVRLLLDGRALKQDLAETFDDWVPKRAEPGTVVYVFFAGRALVDGATGAVSLVPFDGTTSGGTRLYSVRRLQEALVRSSIQRAILMFDVSLEAAPGVDSAATLPNWEAGLGERRDGIMWMVAHKGLQESHAYEPARHGLFTYHLLRGLQGVADVDRDGTVAAGELCLYARGQVSRIAREQYGNEQDPLCLPPPGHGAMVRIHPMAKGNNPKPAPTSRAEEKPDSLPSNRRPSSVGPGQ
ncbi:MAG: hypothetical protein ICV75_06670 [Nitrospiraceae bacterium]|nr:hypothetical protein [Nitrospiraceae bacterium]